MHLLSLPLAAFSGLNVGLIFGLSGMAFAAFFGFLGMYFHHRKQALWHETARLALEKGQPVPLPSPDEESWSWQGNRGAATPAPAATSDYRREEKRRGLMIGGLVNIAVGAGLYFALFQVSPATAAFAAIPGFIGVALLLGAIVDSLLSRKSGN